MVTRFSERYNLRPEKAIQINEIDLDLLNRLWNIIRDTEFVGSYSYTSDGTVERLLDFLKCTYEAVGDSFAAQGNLKKLRKRLVDATWYEIYDVIEIYLELKESYQRKLLERSFNLVLEEEKSGYRIIKGLVTPITDKESIKTLEKSLKTPFGSANKHMEKALILYSDRKNPDYENSIKESISAVEAMCCVITGAKGGEATLGKMLKKLEDKGIHIHGSLKGAFTQLYGFTSDENGIRHGGEDFKNASSEDAYFMLISCSAFINYLKVKYSKIK